MNQKATEQQKVTSLKKDEKILVVPRKNLFEGEGISGFYPLTNFEEYIKLIETHRQFQWRSEMETNPTYKQIIPYLIFSYQNKYFLMQRKGSASEQRLKNKFSLGIGGHIREEDIKDSDMMSWAAREFDEEIAFQGTYSIHPLGIINDESNDVGKVHTGFVFLLKGNSDMIQIRSELKQGHLFTLEECNEYYNNMESWTQLVFDHLITLS